MDDSIWSLTFSKFKTYCMPLFRILLHKISLQGQDDTSFITLKRWHIRNFIQSCIYLSTHAWWRGNPGFVPFLHEKPRENFHLHFSTPAMSYLRSNHLSSALTISVNANASDEELATLLRWGDVQHFFWSTKENIAHRIVSAAIAVKEQDKVKKLGQV